MKTIKQRLIEEIKTFGMTTSEIAVKSGISPDMLLQYKKATRLPSLETFALLCKAIDASADYILGLKSESVENKE